MSKVEIKNLYKIFGKNPTKNFELFQSEHFSKEQLLDKTNHILGLNNINLNINESEFYVIIGLSGSGKSTLIRCINRLYEPTSGQIIIDGIDITALNKKELRTLRRDKISMIFQKFGLFNHQTVYENITYSAKIKNEPISFDKVQNIIELIGLTGYENSLPEQLSGGMQQRVGIARALYADSDIILMDEAFSALDPIVRHQLQDELLEIKNETNKTIIFITHDINEALKLGDRLTIMKEGEIIQTGTPEEIINNPINEYVEDFLVNSNKIDFIKLKQFAITEFNTFDLEENTNELKLDTSYKLSVSIVTQNNKYYGLVKNIDIKDNLNIPLKNITITKGVESIPSGKTISNVLIDTFKRRHPFVVVNSKKEVISIVKRDDIIAFVESEMVGD